MTVSWAALLQRIRDAGLPGVREALKGGIVKLLKAQVSLFRNILDSTEVDIEDGVTCLVGKNESGKTAFLHALYRLNPARDNVSFSVPEQYPAWLEKRHRLRGGDLETVCPVRGVFSVEAGDREALSQRFGTGTFAADMFALERSYAGELVYDIEIDEHAAVKHIVSRTGLPPTIAMEASQIQTLEGLEQFATDLRARMDQQAGEQEPATEEQPEEQPVDLRELATALEGSMREVLGGLSLRKAIEEALYQRIPTFFYFDVYSTLPARVDIQQLLRGNERDLDDNHRTALSLLRLAAADNEYVLTSDYERRKRELENIANAITAQILEYWTQNPTLRVEIDITLAQERNSQGQPIAVVRELRIRIWDQQHWLSLPFDEHSTGFCWFFSFLAAFYEYSLQDRPLIILLDEPALGLHARAQKDFLRFIDEKLADKHQVIHTTHSPFMVQPGRLERVRIVEDRGQDVGVEITSDVLSTDPDTLFPLQGALGYDLVQHLFIGPYNLVVEGTSDYTYLQVMSDFLKEQGREGLKECWSVVPVGGADLIPTFVALLGHHLDVTVLLDARKGGDQKLTRLANDGYLAHKRLITVGDVLGRKRADIEDVFLVEDYVLLYNRAFTTSIQPSDLTGRDPLVSRIARHEGVDRFDHGRPAEILLRYRDEILPQFQPGTIDRFERLFIRINETAET